VCPFPVCGRLSEVAAGYSLFAKFKSLGRRERRRALYAEVCRYKPLRLTWIHITSYRFK
jgi:hypothetical protein